MIKYHIKNDDIRYLARSSAISFIPTLKTWYSVARSVKIAFSVEIYHGKMEYRCVGMLGLAE
jgi:hypothetical protein